MYILSDREMLIRSRLQNFEYIEKDLINQDQYTIKVNGVLAQDLTEAIDLKVSVVYHVTVGP